MATIKGFEVSGIIYDNEDETARENSATNTNAIGTLSALLTTVKTNLVAAINELVTKFSTNVDPYLRPGQRLFLAGSESAAGNLSLVSISPGTTFNIANNGLLYFYLMNSSAGDSFPIDINGLIYHLSCPGTSSGNETCLQIPVQAGDIITIKTSLPACAAILYY